MVKLYSTITIAQLKEQLSHNRIWHLNDWVFYLYEGIDVDVDRDGPEFYPYGPRIARVSFGAYNGEKIIDLVYGVDYSEKDTGFEDIMRISREYDLPDTTKIYLRKDRTFEFKPIKSLHSYIDVVLFEPYK